VGRNVLRLFRLYLLSAALSCTHARAKQPLVCQRAIESLCAVIAIAN